MGAGLPQGDPAGRAWPAGGQRRLPGAFRPCYYPRMQLTLLLNTGNEHKKREVAEICSSHTVHMRTDFGLDGEFEEVGETFLENALGKAQTLADELAPDGFERLGIHAVIADDSGISVRALDDGPGIYSARFGAAADGTHLSAGERNALLLEKLSGVTDRTAYYTCCMAAVLADGRILTVEDRLYGEIAHQPSSGAGGFGYDPIFYLPDRECTVADITDAEKHIISHRGRACRDMIAALEPMLAR